MKVEFKYRHTQASEELHQYVSDRIGRLGKYEMKPVRVGFTFSTDGDSKCVDIHARSEDIEMHARCEAEDFFTAIDTALEKLGRQLAKKKARVQDHKAPSHLEGPQRKGTKVG
jgi:ribosomal subunit interface protein